MRGDEIEKFKESSLVIDLVTVELKNKGNSLYGNGIISQDENGKLQLKVFCERMCEKQGLLISGKNIKTKVGEIIHSDEYYSIVAKDIKGRNWESERILISETCGPDGDLIINAKLFEITCKKEHGMDTKYFAQNFIFPFEGYYPCTSSTTSIKTNHRSQTQTSIVRDSATYKINDLDIDIQQVPKYLNIKLASESKQAFKFAYLRISETLQFVLATRMEWIYSKYFDHNSEIIRLRSFPTQERQSIIQPPVHPKDYETEDDFGKLFIKFYDYISQHTEDNYHPISSFILAVILGGQGTVETIGLALGTSCEGVLNSEFKIIVTPTVTESEITHVQNLISGDVNINDTLKRRFLGFILKLNVPNAMAELKYLKEKEVFEGNLIEDWRILRDSLAHPDPNKPKGLQEYRRLINSATVLFYKLIFQSIQYSGKYRDYSSPEWPNREFKYIDIQQPEGNFPFTND